MGHSQFPLALFPRQPPRSHRWHPHCCRCLLKGCERWFLPACHRACYCSQFCQKAAERWRRWHACQRYRATIHGKERRREQAKRYRERLRQRSSPAEPALPTPAVEPASAVNEAATLSKTDPPQQSLPPARASAQPKPPKILATCLATGPAAMSCSSPQRQRSSKNSARACAAGRYDAFASGKPDSGSGGGVVSGLSATPIAIPPKRLRSCRHQIEAAILRTFNIAFAPQNRRGSGRAGLSGPPFPCSVSVPGGEARHD